MNSHYVLLYFVIVVSFAFITLMKLFWDLLSILKINANRVNEREAISSVEYNPPTTDHDPFIKTCVEIVRMKKRLERIDVKETRHLKKSLERLEEYFKERGYEIINHEGLAYNEGMSVIANFIPSENLKRGERVITKVVKPQINYNNSIIYSAEVEVSYGE
jgi:hypothetical protein